MWLHQTYYQLSDQQRQTEHWKAPLSAATCKQPPGHHLGPINQSSVWDVQR